MSGARIEVAELVSFRLKMPREALQRLPEELAGEVPLSLTVEEGELVLSDAEADSFLRFRPIGREAVLTDAAVLNDARGRFFRSVFGALLVRFGGDLDAHLVWSDEGRNASEAWTEVRVERGATRFPGLAAAVSANRLAAAASADAVFGEPGTGGRAQGAPSPGPEALQAAPADGDEAAGPTAEQRAEFEEVAQLLARAAEAWEEYQRLKAARLEPKR
jgi:hypothetical protein